jgi:hypothetical protein
VCDARPLHMNASLVREPRRALLKFVYPLRRFCLRKLIVELLSGIAAERLEVRALCGRHRFIPRLPFIGIAL